MPVELFCPSLTGLEIREFNFFYSSRPIVMAYLEFLILKLQTHIIFDWLIVFSTCSRLCVFSRIRKTKKFIIHHDDTSIFQVNRKYLVFFLFFHSPCSPCLFEKEILYFPLREERRPPPSREVLMLPQPGMTPHTYNPTLLPEFLPYTQPRKPPSKTKNVNEISPSQNLAEKKATRRNTFPLHQGGGVILITLLPHLM